MSIASINPATGVTIQRFDEHSEAEVERKLQTAVRAFERHRRTSFQVRAEKMRRAGEILEKEKRS